MSAMGQTTEELLGASAEQYAALQRHAEQLRIVLDSGSLPALREHFARLTRMQQEAERLDEELLPLLKEDSSAWQERPLYQQRLRSIQAILDLNELLLPRIRGIIAVSSVELEQLRAGRSALAGYAPQGPDRRALRGVG